MLKGFLAVMTSRVLWEAVFVALIGLLIILAGPLLAFDGARPLADAGGRRLALAVIIALWLLLRWLPRCLHLRRQKRLFRQLTRPDAAPAAQSDERLLPDSFKRTVRLLRHRQFSGAGPLLRYWQRIGRQYLYQLPWYLVLGNEECGKSKALQYAGLDFHHSLQEINSLSPEDKPANHCDWYLTPRAVLLSPAGAYLRDDNRYWRQMTGLLRRYRGQQPINGVVLAISAQDLLHSSLDEQYRQATLLRKRLMDLRRQFKIAFPVYFMITKTDRLTGFSQYFSRFDGPELEQCWGMTLPWPGQRSRDVPVRQALDEGYDRLQYRLDAALADMLALERDARLQAQILAFPQAFAGMRPALMRYLSIICLSSENGQALSPRGVFFTSANQKAGGASAGPVRRDNVFDYGYAPQEERREHDADKPSAPQSYFLKSLFREVILAEGNLAGRNRWAAYRRRLASVAGGGLLLLAMGISMGGSVGSYYHNQAYLAQVEERIDALARRGAGLDFQHAADLAGLLSFLEELRELPRQEHFDTSRPPLDHRMGMYRGNLMASAGAAVYQHALKRLLLPLAAQHISRMLYQADFSDTELTYRSLTAYQMLYQSRHYDADFLLAWLDATLPMMPGVAGLDETRRGQLRQHLRRLMVCAPLLSPYAKDVRLEREAQAAIMKIALPWRAYTRMKARLLHDNRFPATSLTELAGDQGDLVFERKSGLANNEPMAGFYTPAGYWLGVHVQADAAVEEIVRQDSWVLHHDTSPDRAILTDKVRLLYMNDFIQQWEHFLGDIAVKQTLNLNQRISNVRILSGERSPLRELLLNTGRILSLPVPEDGGAISGTGGEFGHETRRMLNRMFSLPREERGSAAPEDMVRNHFRDIIELARRPQSNSDGVLLGDVLKQLDGLYHYLTALHGNDNPPARQDGLLTRLRADAMRLPPPFRQQVLTLADEAGNDTRSQTMLRLRQLFDIRIGGFYQFALKGRYPLEPDSALEISPDDFAHMFAPDIGLADRFYEEYLADKVNTREAQWRFLPWVQAEDTPAEQQLLKFFQDAAYLRDAFFRYGGQTPSFSFTVRPLVMDNRILSLDLDIDGQGVSYHHGPLEVFHLNWPGLGRSARAKLSLTLADGAVKTLQTEGPWAWHRLLAKANARWDRRQTASRVTFTLDGHNATLDIAANSMRNPFALPRMGDITPQEAP